MSRRASRSPGPIVSFVPSRSNCRRKVSFSAACCSMRCRKDSMSSACRCCASACCRRFVLDCADNVRKAVINCRSSPHFSYSRPEAHPREPQLVDEEDGYPRSADPDRPDGVSDGRHRLPARGGERAGLTGTPPCQMAPPVREPPPGDGPSRRPPSAGCARPHRETGQRSAFPCLRAAPPGGLGAVRHVQRLARLLDLHLQRRQGLDPVLDARRQPVHQRPAASRSPTRSSAAARAKPVPQPRNPRCIGVLSGGPAPAGLGRRAAACITRINERSR